MVANLLCTLNTEPLRPDESLLEVLVQALRLVDEQEREGDLRERSGGDIRPRRAVLGVRGGMLIQQGGLQPGGCRPRTGGSCQCQSPAT